MSLRALPTFGLAAAWLLGLMASPSVAHGAEEGDWQTKRAERRGGLVLGVAFGYGLQHASGYPNKADQIDVPAYYAANGVALAGASSFLVMGALTDYLNFGFWFGGGAAENNNWKSSVGGGGFRVEAFPLYGLVPKLRDLALFTQLGLGATKIEAKRGNYPGAEGVQSYVGVGSFYEWSFGEVRWLGGHISGGPSLEYTTAFSRSVDVQALTAGVRLAYYGGP